MNTISIDEGERLQCPYCDHLVLDGEFGFSRCSHTLYFANVEGIEYLADSISLDKTKYKSSSCIDEITDALTAKSDTPSVKYIIGSGSGMDGYIGFESNK